MRTCTVMYSRVLSGAVKNAVSRILKIQEGDEPSDMKPMINYYITFSRDVQSYICHRKLFYSDATAYSFLANRPEQGVKRLTAIAVHPGAQRWLERL